MILLWGHVILYEFLSRRITDGNGFNSHGINSFNLINYAMCISLKRERERELDSDHCFHQLCYVKCLIFFFFSFYILILYMKNQMNI